MVQQLKFKTFSESSDKDIEELFHKFIQGQVVQNVDFDIGVHPERETFQFLVSLTYKGETFGNGGKFNPMKIKIFYASTEKALDIVSNEFIQDKFVFSSKCKIYALDSVVCYFRFICYREEKEEKQLISKRYFTQ